MCVDEPFLRTFHLLDGQWEECTVENFHEGDYRGVHFSAANVRLDHVYERGCGHEGYETCHEMVFKGLVLRCETQTPAPSPVLVNARTEDSPRGAATGDALFDRCFCVTAEPEQDALSLLAPQFMELMNEFRQRVEGQLLGFRWEGRVLSLAVETDYGFAAVASNVDLRDLDALRRSVLHVAARNGGNAGSSAEKHRSFCGAGLRKDDTMGKNQTMTDEQLARELQNGKRGGGRGKLLTVIGCAATAIGIFTSVTALTVIGIVVALLGQGVLNKHQKAAGKSGL
ncbi:MAG: DUF3137 domain-containing protein [Oscillibacter sp.]